MLIHLPLTPTPQYLYASNSSKSPEFSLLNYTGNFQGTYLSGSVAWKNNIYAFGGEGAKEGNFKNTFIKIRIDSNPIIIEQLDNTNAPSPRGRLTPVVDKQGKIYFFGGWDGTGNDNTMYIFDSNNATLTTVKSNSAPDMIWGYAAIFTNGGIVILDLSTTKLTQPNVEGKRPDYIPFQATATYFNDYIFVAFGKRNNDSSAEFNILDISSGALKWVQVADLTRTPKPPSPSILMQKPTPQSSQPTTRSSSHYS
ncbi:8191_t:CDS:2, partial [Ambispora gerdemannii]